MKKLILSLCSLISIRAYAEQKEYSVIAACNYGLGFFTTEGGCLAVWHKSDVLDLNYVGYSTNGSFLVISPEIGLAF